MGSTKLVLILGLILIVVGGCVAEWSENPYILHGEKNVNLAQRNARNSLWMNSIRMNSKKVRYNPGVFLVKFDKSTSQQEITKFCASFGLINEGQIGNLDMKLYKLSTEDGLAARRQGIEATSYLDSGLMEHMQRYSIVSSVEADRELYLVPKMAFPDDPEMNVAYHVQNRKYCGYSTYVAPLFEVDVVGTNVVIGVCDSGVWKANPELKIRSDWCVDLSDLNSTDSNPDLSLNDWDHGTGVASVAAGKASNGICACGTAPNATIVGMKMTGSFFSSVILALAHHEDDIWIKNFSLGFTGCTSAGCQLDDISASVYDAFGNSANSGRNGKGTIHVWAASNEGDYGGDTTMSGFTNTRFNFPIAALNEEGKQSWYSNFGAGVIVAAPGGGTSQGIPFETLFKDGAGTESGKCVKAQGTSFASPAAAGVMALMLETNQDLGWRDVKGILALSSNKTDPSDSDWALNGKNYNINHKYGFGLIDATKAVYLAQNWNENFGEELEVESYDNTGKVIDGADSVIHTITPVINGTTCPGVANLSECTFVTEHVILELSMDCGTPGSMKQVGIGLESPDGTVSQLINLYTTWNGVSEYSSWTMLSVRHWGEDPTGDWLLIFEADTGGNCTYTESTLMITGHMDGSNNITYLTPATAFSGYTPSSKVCYSSSGGSSGSSGGGGSSPSSSSPSGDLPTGSSYASSNVVNLMLVIFALIMSLIM